MKILALELSSGQGSIAWSEGAADSFASSFSNDRKHSGLFFENLEACLARRGKPDRIVVGLGPGSYAGTRIAIATAIGLQTATAAHLIGLASVCAMPSGAPEYAVIGDARRQSFFFALVRDRLAVEGPLLCTEEELRDRLSLLASPVFSSERLAAFPDATLAYPSAVVLAEIAATAPSLKNGESLEPIYLRDPHITQPKRPTAASTQ